jgi:osmotically-inducible protein OsmY
MTHPTRKSDAQLQDDVIRALRRDPRVQASDLGVAVTDAAVTLTGAVETGAQRLAAQRATLGVAGVRDLANELVVRPAGSPARSDADIARAVGHTLAWDSRVPHGSVTSTVTAGHVTLAGLVDHWSQRDDAEEAIRHLTGVTGVTNDVVVRAPAVADVDVRRVIAEALQRHAAREAQHIEVRVFDGQVTLEGPVDSWLVRQAVVGAVGAMPGVRAVSDRLHTLP